MRPWGGLVSRDPDSIITFEGADLARADLSTTFIGAVNLTGADLSEADLEGAVLTRRVFFLPDPILEDEGANLTNAVLENATLTNADLRRATLTGAALGAADLSDAGLGELT